MAKAYSLPHEDSFRLLEYRLPGDWPVLVGRTDADNDYLSLRLARPNDWWFHVRGLPGSHVILQSRPGEEPDRQTLKRAAAIAAYHSKARQAGVVAVSCTRARYVTKPHGAPVGTVQIRKETVLKVRPELGDAVITQASDSANKA
jgi:predicted ribosome quality control (RQC) complex YloA/Tae2 family protein